MPKIPSDRRRTHSIVYKWNVYISISKNSPPLHEKPRPRKHVRSAHAREQAVNYHVKANFLSRLNAALSRWMKLPFIGSATASALTLYTHTHKKKKKKKGRLASCVFTRVCVARKFAVWCYVHSPSTFFSFIISLNVCVCVWTVIGHLIFFFFPERIVTSV